MQKNKKVKFYSVEFKKQVVEDIVKTGLGISNAMIKYSIGSERSVYRWLRKYKKFYTDDKNTTLPIMEKEKLASEDLSKEVLIKQKESLEVQLKQALLELEASKILIDIAKEEFNIDLRKKRGAKRLQK